MCKSKAKGGQRCAAHTRKALDAALTAHEANPTADTFDRVQAARAEYASTPQGYKVLSSQRLRAMMDRNRQAEYEDLSAALERGAQTRRRNLAVDNEVQAASPSSAERIAVLRRMEQPSWAKDNLNNLSDATLTRLSRDPEELVRVELARYKGTLPAEAMETLAEDPTDRVKQAIARRRDLPEKALRVLGSSPDPKIRRATLTMQPGSGFWARRSRPYVLNKLTDPDTSVRAAAVEAWIQHGYQPGHRPDYWELPPAEVVSSLLAERDERLRQRAKAVFLDEPARRAAGTDDDF